MMMYRPHRMSHVGLGASTSLLPTVALSFSNGTRSRDNSTFQPGDLWFISISGATPNSPVTISGSGPNGNFTNSQVGSTDSNGNFASSAMIGPNDIGNWAEQWYVGGQEVGTVNFTVFPVPSVTVPTATNLPTVQPQNLPSLPIVQSSGEIPAGAFQEAMTPVTASSFISAIPWWGWAAGLGLGAYLMFGGRR